MEKQVTIMEDAEDAGLKAVMGSRFRDVSRQTRQKEKQQPRVSGKAAMWAVALGVFGWWLHSGQMELSAAIPGMVFCAFMGGCRFGKGR